LRFNVGDPHLKSTFEKLTASESPAILHYRPSCAYRQEDDAVTLSSRQLLTAAVGLWMTLPSLGQEPARFEAERDQASTLRSGLSANQRSAESIAEQLRQSGQLHQYRVDVSFKDGIAELSGSVADQSQRDQVLRLVRGVAGVQSVVDNLSLASDEAITRVQAPVPPPPPPVTQRRAENGPETPIEPVPAGAPQAPSLYDSNPPKMPPYAWPTYAPYNNYSRVAYPEAYPYGAWPFIGPMYPFPKIPLGWRSVKLEWQDGHWWFSKVATKHDWWRVRYW
jgi:hypothetical protein